eukprot:4495466-Amphidinium_carterae.1
MIHCPDKHMQMKSATRILGIQRPQSSQTVWPEALTEERSDAKWSNCQELAFHRLRLWTLRGGATTLVSS